MILEAMISYSIHYSGRPRPKEPEEPEEPKELKQFIVTSFTELLRMQTISTNEQYFLHISHISLAATFYFLLSTFIFLLLAFS